VSCESMGVTLTSHRVVLLTVAAGIAGVVLAGCSPVEERRSGSAICQLHRTKMQTEVVYPCNKLIHFTADYGRAQPKLFPNVGVGYGPSDYDYERRPFKVYVCPACVRARDEYTQRQVSR
jgi:hypothetical protein